MKYLLYLSLSILMSFGTLSFIGCAPVNGQIVVKVKPVLPPMPPAKAKPHKPGPNHVWVAGHHKWDKRHGKYVWVAGQWVKVKPGKVWVPGHWKNVKGGFKWVPGHWK